MQKFTSEHYGKEYFDWQRPLGEFGGWANMTKFEKYLCEKDWVLDFGCGGGFLLKNLVCAQKIGIEPNLEALKTARDNGIEVYSKSEELPDNYVDKIISNNALEHTLHPLMELKKLYKKLKNNGMIIFVVPCESITYEYKPNDINHHLYSWSPMCIGNLFTEAGFEIIESKPYIHKWPPNYLEIAKQGRDAFEKACKEYGYKETSWYQVRCIGKKS
ncbi:MAG: methyltransferase domain-containing protein [Desulfamplus sp.]|nr:methyltransferase domain-containing protein [Desulfamplus sp.]